MISDRSGPVCHHCSIPSELQWPRHATAAEATAHFDALENNILASGNPGYVQDRSGQVQLPVHACGDHVLPMPCTHAEQPPVPCPVCHAAPGSECVGLDGGPRAVEHRERAAAQPVPESCTHAHDAGCGGYGACQCAATTAKSKKKPKA
jgi:hypothetical protein